MDPLIIFPRATGIENNRVVTQGGIVIHLVQGGHLQGFDDRACILVRYGNAVTDEPGNQCLFPACRLTPSICEQGLQLAEIHIDPVMIPNSETSDAGKNRRQHSDPEKWAVGNRFQ